MLLLAASAAATTWVVALDGSGDFGQIQDAIDLARAGDVVEVLPGEYFGDLVIRNRSITLRGSDPATTIINGAGAGSALQVMAATVNVEGLQLRNPGGMGLHALERSDVSLTDIWVLEAGGPEVAGAIVVEDGEAVLDRVVVEGVEASGGWGLSLYAGSAALTDCEFRDGVGPQGAVWLGSNTVVTFSGLTVERSEGGAVRVESGARVRLESSSLASNHAAAGAGLWLGPAASLTLVETVLEGNQADSGGDGLHIDAGGAAVVLASAFVDHPALAVWAGAGATLDDLSSTYAGNPEAIRFTDAAGSLSDLTITDAIEAITATNSTLTLTRVLVELGGRAVTATGGTLTATDLTLSELRGNGWAITTEDTTVSLSGLVASELDGAVSARGGSFAMAAGTLSEVGGSQDGALHVSGADFSLSDSSFSRCATSGEGGAVWVSEPRSFVVERNLYVENEASVGGAVWAEGLPAGATWQHERFIGNVAGEGAAVALFGEGALRFATFAGHGPSVVAGELTGAGIAFVSNDSPGLRGGSCEACGFDVELASFAPDLAATFSVVGDPRFVGWPASEPALADLRLLRSSPLVDSGPAGELDADGSPADIGAWGGPGLVFADADNDGASALTDCNDADPIVRPGAVEYWYDGTDQDCDGNDLDQDGDGVLLASDCNDTDPALTTDCTPDTDGEPEPEPEGCGGCASGDASPGLAVLAVASGALRSRRRV